jgi:DeoR family fructose operon transcriptional repressor
VKFADVHDVDVFVTDEELPPRERQAFENEGVTVVEVPPE